MHQPQKPVSGCMPASAIKTSKSCKQRLEAIKVHLQDTITIPVTLLWIKSPCWSATNAAHPGANEMVADVGQIAKNRDTRTLTRLGRCWWCWWWCS